MRNDGFMRNQKCENFIDWWRNAYCFIIPSIVTVLFFITYYFGKVKIWESENFTDTLSSVITFVSIIISFFGVLLTILITAKEKSELIQYFLDSADKDAFIASIKRLIMCGLLTVIIAACLFLEDIMAEVVKVFLLCINIFALIKFTALTYRFTNILLMLFIRNKDEFKKKEGTKVSEKEVEAMDERIKRGI